jgi:hypothetical protein
MKHQVEKMAISPVPKLSTEGGHNGPGVAWAAVKARDRSTGKSLHSGAVTRLDAMGRCRLIVGITRRDWCYPAEPISSEGCEVHWRCTVRIDRMYIDPHSGEPSRPPHHREIPE